MEIAENHMVEIDYRLTDGDGNVIDTSEGHGPLAYIQGKGQLIPGLEAALEGKVTGDNFNVVIEPGDAYGEKNDELVYTMPKENFASIENLQVGMQVEMNDGTNRYIMTVADITDTDVSVDGNHPLAGVSLHFDVTVRSVRMATDEELTAKQGCGCGGDCSDDDCADDCGCDDEGCDCR